MSTTLSKQYHFGEDMTDEDSLAHYGVKGMKWGQRKKANSFDIKKARRNVGAERDKLREQADVVARTHKGNRAAQQAKLDKMTAAYLKNPDRVTSARLTRGEKVASVLLTGPLGLVAIAATSGRSRRIEYKQDANRYDKD